MDRVSVKKNRVRLRARARVRAGANIPSTRNQDRSLPGGRLPVVEILREAICTKARQCTS